MRYTEDTIEVLEGLEPVRKRPGMYIGDVNDGSGLHHMLWELVANSVDEHLAGHARKIRVRVEPDAIEIEDDGRGLPVEADPRTGVPWVQRALTTLHSSGSLDGHAPHVHISPQLFGIGLAAVNALSERFDVEVHRGGYVWRQIYSYGRPMSRLERGEGSDRTGTRIRLIPDRTIFTKNNRFDVCAIAERLREVATFNPGLSIELDSVLDAPTGIAAFIERRGIDDVFSTRGRVGDVIVEAAIGWRENSPMADLRSFANQSRTVDGGTHERGFWEGLARAIRSVDPKRRRPRNLRAHFTPGLCAVVHVILLRPEYSGNARARLYNEEAIAAVREHVGESYAQFLRSRPELTQRLLTRLD